MGDLMSMACLARALLVITLVLSVAVLRGQEEGRTPDDFRLPPAKNIPGIEAKAAALLQIVKPAETKSKTREAWKEIHLEDGNVVRWGRFVRPDEVAALVSVKEPGEESDFDLKRHDVSYFVWHKGQWELRQFLGNANDLSVHYRSDRPSVFLQGSFKTGRYDGEFVSWFYDEKKGQWIPTGFEDLGPFYLKGGYLVTERGFERLAHDDTRLIYSYRNGKKGALLVRCDFNDMGSFSIEIQDSGIKPGFGWSFQQDRDDESHMTVEAGPMVNSVKDKKADAVGGTVNASAEIRGEVNPYEIFELLTGLDSTLLERGWNDDLPPHSPLRVKPFKVTGDAQIVKRLSGPEMRAYEEEERCLPLAAVAEIAPTGKEDAPAEVVAGSSRTLWGRLFGGLGIEALVAIGPKEGEVYTYAKFYLLRWEGTWKFVQFVGEVPYDTDPREKPSWGIRSYAVGEQPPAYYVLGDVYGNRGDDSTWCYDKTARRLVSTGWVQKGIPSIADGCIDFHSQSSQAGSTELTDVFRFDGQQPGARIGQFRPGRTEGQRLCYVFRIPDEKTGKDVIWRLWKMEVGYHPHGDHYVLSRDEEEGREFRQDATLEVDWGDGGGDQTYFAAYLWNRLTGTGPRTFFRLWQNEKVPEVDVPKSVTVTGLPEAIRLFSWPQENAEESKK